MVSDLESDRGVLQSCRPNRDEYPDDKHKHADGDANYYADSEPNGYSHINAIAEPSRDPNTDADRHTDQCPDGNRDGKRNANADGHPD